MTESSKLNFGTCVVSGGAGAIGARLTRRLLDAGAQEVHVIDDLSSGYRWLLPDDSRVNVVEGDVVNIFADSFDVQNAHVFHLAAFFANQNSVDHPVDDLHTNGLGTLQVLKWASEHGAKRVVYASAGCSIAGHGVDGPITEDMPVSLHLDTPYQITKALGEFYCNYYLDLVSSVRCRFFNSYGPGEVPGPYRNVIPNFIWLALRDQPLTITGTGQETRDFIYVDDLVEGLIRCAVVDDAHGEAINLGTGRQTKIVDLANTIIRIVNSKSEVRYTSRRAWDNSKTRQADNSKARKLLSLSTDVRVEQGLEETVSWFLEHIDNIEHSCEF
jgi:nucleoside-diphosphate-sugar epimerase